MRGTWRAERDEAQKNVVAFVDGDPHDLEVILEEVGDDECILREETKAVVGTSFGGARLDRLVLSY